MTTSNILQAIRPQRELLLRHPLYETIKTVDDLRVFLEHHVFAVWDFMSLLKALQQKLTCTTTPWFPSPNPEIRYLINEIVLAEESDLAPDGSRKSHYEMYLSAMKACGADTLRIEGFIADVVALKNVFVGIRNSGLHEDIRDFLDFTFRIIEEGKTHKIASAFTFGREDLIPEMFTQILQNFARDFPQTDLSELLYYFERHISLDADEHGPMAMTMMNELCQSDELKWREAKEVAIEALEKRLKLWDAIALHIRMKPELA